MGRPRKTDKHLPPCVYHNHGAYYLVRGGKWIPLGHDLSTALAEYGRTYNSPKGTMPALIDTVLEHVRPRLARASYEQYRIAAGKLKNILAEFAPNQVKQKHVAQIKLALANTPNMANRVLSFLRQVFDYALEQQLVDSNPAIGIKRHKEAKRQRLLSAAEFQAIRSAAGDRLQVIMDLAYLTGQRIGDVLCIRVTDLLEDGIAFAQQKSGVRLVVRWSPDLRSVVERAKTLHGNIRALTLLHNRRGKAPDYRTVRDQWDAACAAAAVTDANLHDLRAMSLTAAKGEGKDATALAGHASPAMTARYLRDRQAPIVDGPSIRRAQ
jgi:integrase